MSKGKTAFYIVLLLPSVVVANAGTPLLWAGMVHLWFVNILIGIGESIAIKRVGKSTRSYRQIVPVTLVANYASAFLGMFVLSLYTESMGHNIVSPTLDQYVAEHIVLYISLTLSSIFAEYLFYYYLLPGVARGAMLKLSFKINGSSSLIVICFYLVFHAVTVAGN